MHTQITTPTTNFHVATLSHNSWTLSAPKILLYSHDTAGLGNIRRTLLLAETLMTQYPAAAILIVTGSPMIHAFRIPDGIDYIKLPCLDRIDADRYEPRFLSTCTDEVKHTRKTILTNAILGFNPDLMIVDKRPAGVDGELLDALQAIQRRRLKTRLVLGIRDILDEPERTRTSLKRAGCFNTIEQYYDEVWIYGERTIFDAIREYAFPEAVARMTRYCGYLKRPTTLAPPHSGPPNVLVTTGGGGDGSDMIAAYLEGLLGLPRRLALRTTVVFGPQMPTSRRTVLQEQFGHMTDVTFVDFEADLTRRYAEADVVVSMAGYNTVCELLSFGRRAILVPRAEPVQEQLIRARLFAARGYFDMIEPQDLTPDNLMAKVLSSLAQGPHLDTPVDLDGLPRIHARVRALLTKEKEAA
jgi:predicted glycosyltransferase